MAGVLQTQPREGRGRVCRSVLYDDACIGIDHRRVCEGRKGAGERAAGYVGVRRIAENKLKAISVKENEAALYGLGNDLDLLAETKGLDVCPNREESIAPPLDEGCVRGPARDCLEPERARPCVKVEDPRFFDGARGGQNAKDGLPDAIRSGTRFDPARGAQASRSMKTTRNPHTDALC